MSKVTIHDGKLLNYNADLFEVEENMDPYENMRIITRQAMDDDPEVRRFEIPNDNDKGLCLDKSTIATEFTIPSNYVPDNDVLAKGIAKVEMTVENTKMFATLDTSAYYYHSHIDCKLNKSPNTQEVEMFPTGRYDSYDIDANELKDKYLHSNGKNCIENRQQYAKPVWKSGGIFQPNGRNGKFFISYRRLYHQYSVRAPFVHGFAKQPRLIPPRVKVKVEFRMNEQGHAYLKHTEYQICRANKNLLKRMKYPFHEDMELEEYIGTHENQGECDCLEKLTTKEYKKLEQIYEQGVASYDLEGNALYAKLANKTANNTEWRKHKYYKMVPKLEVIEDKNEPEDRQECYFGMTKDLVVTELFNPSSFIFESLFKDPACDNELPVQTGKKAESFIPFYNPEFQRIELSAGRQEYTKTISSGIIPKAIVISGQPYARKPASFEYCSTKSKLHWPGFEIKKFTIFVNEHEHFRTPFTEDYQHYQHFLEQTKNWQTKNGIGINFFDFRDNNWMVPLCFDDASGKSAVIKVKIEFERTLAANYDILVESFPYKEVLLNKDTQRK